jgi:hypothetical protein
LAPPVEGASSSSGCLRPRGGSGAGSSMGWSAWTSLDAKLDGRGMAGGGPCLSSASLVSLGTSFGLKSCWVRDGRAA